MTDRRYSMDELTQELVTVVQSTLTKLKILQSKQASGATFPDWAPEIYVEAQSITKRINEGLENKDISVQELIKLYSEKDRLLDRLLFSMI